MRESEPAPARAIASPRRRSSALGRISWWRTSIEAGGGRPRRARVSSSCTPLGGGKMLRNLKLSPGPRVGPGGPWTRRSESLPDGSRNRKTIHCRTGTYNITSSFRIRRGDARMVNLPLSSQTAKGAERRSYSLLFPRSRREPSFKRARARRARFRAGPAGPLSGFPPGCRALSVGPAGSRADGIAAPVRGRGGSELEADHSLCRPAVRGCRVLLHAWQDAGRGPAPSPAVAGGGRARG